MYVSVNAIVYCWNVKDQNNKIAQEQLIKNKYRLIECYNFEAKPARDYAVCKNLHTALASCIFWHSRINSPRGYQCREIFVPGFWKVTNLELRLHAKLANKDHHSWSGSYCMSIRCSLLIYFNQDIHLDLLHRNQTQPARKYLMHKSLNLTSWERKPLKKHRQSFISIEVMYTYCNLEPQLCIPMTHMQFKNIASICSYRNFGSFIQKMRLTFSSLNHFPWQSRFQPAAVNFSSISRSSWGSKCCCCAITLSAGSIAGQKLFWLGFEFPYVMRSKTSCTSWFLLLELCWVWLQSISEVAFCASSINGLPTDLNFRWKVLQFAVPTEESDSAIRLFISSRLANSLSFSFDSAARWRDPLLCIFVGFSTFREVNTRNMCRRIKQFTTWAPNTKTKMKNKIK